MLKSGLLKYSLIVQYLIIRAPRLIEVPKDFIQDWQQAGLMEPSSFKPLIFSLETSKILMKLGTLTYRDRNRLAEILQQIIG